MAHQSPHDDGCLCCWPEDPTQAWESLTKLRVDHRLIDESHLMVKIRSCPECGQPYVSIFTETIDWEDGDDPQFWCLCPITDREATQIQAQSNGLIPYLRRLAPQRRSLCRDAPKGGPPQVFWAQGIRIGEYD